MEERFKFRRVNEITGTFVLVVIAVLIAAVVWTGRSQRWFKSNVTLRIILPEAGAAGIRQGLEVYFLGTLVGSNVIVDTTGRMEAQANIRHDFFRFVSYHLRHSVHHYEHHRLWWQRGNNLQLSNSCSLIGVRPTILEISCSNERMAGVGVNRVRINTRLSFKVTWVVRRVTISSGLRGPARSLTPGSAISLR